MLQTLQLYRYFSLRPNEEQRAAFLSGPGVLVLVLIDSECDMWVVQGSEEPFKQALAKSSLADGSTQ